MAMGTRRTEGRTSMIPTEIIMTIEARIVCSMDIFSENDVLTLDRQLFPANLQLGAIEWAVERGVRVDVFPMLFGAVLDDVGRRFGGHEVWLITGHSAWQPDTKVVRHRKLFNSLKMLGIGLEETCDRFEFLIERDGKLKYFGAARLAPESVVAAGRTMTPRSCSYILVQPKGIGLGHLPAAGWTGQWNEDNGLVSAVANRNGLLFQRVGFFDDPEVGVVAVSSPLTLKQISPGKSLVIASE